MSGTLSLNGTWTLSWAEGSPLHPPTTLTAVEFEGKLALEAPVPAPIHQVLQAAGLLQDPNLGLNSLAARWVEEMYWVYRRTFTVPAEALGQRAWLAFDKLEICATVWLNGEEVGTHANAHRPARFEVTGRLREGENLLVVRLTTGMHETCDKPVHEYMPDDISRLVRRQFLRKAQYQSGWDWHPRIMNVGILGDVRLEWAAAARLDQVTVFATLSPDLARATFHVRATVAGVAEGEVPAVLRARLVETGQEAELELLPAPGESRPELLLEVESPELWWPQGHGEQPLYTVEVSLAAGGESYSATRRTGVRRVEIDQSPHPVEGQYCILKVNGRPIFCKGGNWTPPDMFLSSVPAERYRGLVDLALAANFNLIRIWGGAVFAPPELVDYCDEKGVMLWHDLLFACAKYPGDDPAFAAEVRREVTWGVREMAHHPALVVWCGNNEIEWGDWAWNYDGEGRTHPHYAIFHHDIPLICREEDPSTVHWLSSPYSPDQKHPNDPTVGDQHPWSVSMSPGGADWWTYRGFVDRFPNEGGLLGASPPVTLRQAIPEAELKLFSPSWVHHDNPFAYVDSVPGRLGHAYQTVRLWLGHEPVEMDWEDYVFASALLQGEGLAEYVANYRRRMFSSASAIFWSFNDSWPSTHGWTIVDYYLRKKLAYHPVRRAYQAVTVVVAEEEGTVTAWGINDSPEEWSGRMRWGLFTLAGERPREEDLAVTLPANSAVALGSFPRGEWEAVGLKRSGAFAVLREGERNVAQHRLFVERFKDLEWAPAEVSLALQDEVLTLQSPTFAWGVCLDLDGEAPLADNCFDLLPGVSYQVPWPQALGEPRVVRMGNGAV